ncbi:ABC transporter ATP-binding protein [Microbacterium sp. ZXX196]|uniref:ABC transporter ATP-binding protein n=1 Tax=Microbacterium sp. ZXX196 TaxID=2609291 RepID=UPI0018ACA92B
MSDGKVLEFSDVSMVFGDVPAVASLTARVEPGLVTAFLGPNGAGKTTTLRILLGQLRPTRGSATIGGRPYSQIVRPAAAIGSVLSTRSLDRFRRKTAAKYLARAAKQVGVSTGRVSEVLTIVGLADMGDVRIDSLSLGMKHRLVVAEALLGDPGVLVFDEPANGLDPEGIRWIRLLMRRFADEGRTVLMSSHLLSEVEQVADALLVLNEGQLLFEGPIELLSEAEGGTVTVDSADRDALGALLASAGLGHRVLRSGIAVDGATASQIGALAAREGIALTTLTHRGPTLEDIYLQIIEGTWQAPARTAALEPAPLAALADDAPAGDEGPAEEPAAGDDEPAEAEAPPSFDELLSGDPSQADIEAHDRALPGSAALAGLASALHADDDDEDEADVADVTDEATDEATDVTDDADVPEDADAVDAAATPAAADEATDDTEPAGTDADDNAGDKTAAEADSAESEDTTESDDDAEPADAAEDAPIDADEAAVAESGDGAPWDDAPSEDEVAGAAEDADEAADREATEPRPADEAGALITGVPFGTAADTDADVDEWSSQLRAMFAEDADNAEDDGPGAESPAPRGFPGAAFGSAATRDPEAS